MPKKKRVLPNPTSLDRIMKSDILIQVDFEKDNYRKIAKFLSKILDRADAGQWVEIEHMIENDREELEEALANVNIH